MGLNVGILGCGNAGSQIAALGSTLKNIPAIALNSSERDIDAVKAKTPIDVLYFGDGKGAGLNREIGKQFVKDHIRNFIQDEKFRAFMDEVDYVFVVNSASGGTGSSFGPILTDILSKYYAAQRAKDPSINKNFINVGILPAINDSIGNQRNTIQYLSEMTPLSLSYMLFDNNNATKLGSTDKIFDAVNKAVVDTISVFRGDYCKLSQYGMIDEADMSKLLTTPGMIFVNILSGIYQEKIKSDATLEDLVIDNINQNNLMVTIDRDKIVKRRGYIANLSKDLHKFFDSNLPKLTDLYGEGIETIPHFSINEDDDEKANYLITMFFGLSLPENRLKQIKSRVQAAEEALSKKKDASILQDIFEDVSIYDDKKPEADATFDLDDIMSKY